MVGLAELTKAKHLKTKIEVTSANLFDEGGDQILDPTGRGFARKSKGLFVGIETEKHA